MIRIENLSKSYGNLQVLKNISLHIAAGETVAIVGPSGTGKSTLLRCLNLLETPTEGKVAIDGLSVDANHLTQKEIYAFRRKSTMIFQDFCLFNNKTVLQNITLAMQVVQKIDRVQAEGEAEEILRQIGLLEKRNNYPGTLSGGQQQRVAIGRAMALKSKVMLLDEPTSALDPCLVGEVLSVIKSITQKHNTTIVIVTHEMRFARDVADRVIYMDEGRIVETASPEVFFTSPAEQRTREFLQYYMN